MYHLFCPKEIFLTFTIFLTYGVLNTCSKYTYFYISKTITLYTFLLVFKIVESLQCTLKPIAFSKSSSINDELNESINLWNKLPDEIVKTILLNAIGSFSNAIQNYYCIMETCSRFQIVKQKGKRLLPRVYIDTYEKFEHSSKQKMIEVSVGKLTKLLGQNSGLLLNISKKKNGIQRSLFFVKKNICGMSYAKGTGKKLSSHLLKKKTYRFGCKMSFFI